MFRSLKKWMFVGAIAAASAAHGKILINEVYVNPPGTDDNREYFEIISTDPAHDSLSGVWLLDLEGDSVLHRSTVDMALNLSSINLSTLTPNANGHVFVLIGSNYATSCPWTVGTATKKVSWNRDSNSPQIENGAVSLLLVSNFTGSVGDQLESPATVASVNGGDEYSDLDSTPWDDVLDSVGWTDNNQNDAVYSIDGHPGLTQSSGTLDACTRFPTNTTDNSQTAWYNADISGTGTSKTYDSTKASSNFPSGTKHITPGTENE